MRRSKVVVSVAGALLLLGLLPGTAWAPKVFEATAVAGPCSIDEVGAGSFSGLFDVSSFTARGALFVNGSLEGECTSGATTAPVASAVRYPVTVADASCTEFRFTLASQKFGTVDVDLSAAEVSLRAQGPAVSDGSLCAAARAYARDDIRRLAQQLNAYLTH